MIRRLCAASAAVALTALPLTALAAPTPAAAAAMAAPAQATPGRTAGMTLADMQARADERFNNADTNKDGVLSAAELAAASAGGGQGRGPGGGGMGGRGLAQADANGDGQVTRDEYRAMITKMFERMDTNGDGVITANERPQMGGMRGPGGQGGGMTMGPDGPT